MNPSTEQILEVVESVPGAEVVILPASRPQSRRQSRRMPLDATTELVLRRAPCRVLLAVARSDGPKPKYPLDVRRDGELVPS